MTLNLFFKIIKREGKISGSQNEIAYELFKESGIFVSDYTIDSWLKPNGKSKRTPNRSVETINEIGFIEYFRTRTNSTWQNLQLAFTEETPHDPIDCDTKDETIFYRSLLMLFYRLLRVVPISLRHTLPEKPHLIGREQELKQLKEIFKRSNYAVITGIGGIGKSYLALAYAHILNETGEWTIQHIICENNDSLQDVICRLQFDGLKDPKSKKFNDRIEILENIQKPMLIILDNLNCPFMSDDIQGFNKLLNCGFHVRFLLTSRHKLEVDKRNLIQVLPPDNDTLLALYQHYRFSDFSNHEEFIKKHKETLKKMFALVGGHTLLIVLLSRLPENALLDEEKIYALLVTGSQLPSDKIFIRKDGAYIENTINEIAKKIFDISQLSCIERSIMKYMTIIPFTGINPDLFEKLTDYSRKDIKNLIQSGWIICDTQTLSIRLHPVICDTMLSQDETKPSKEMCDKICEHIINLRKFCLPQSNEWHTLNKVPACIASRIYFPLISNTQIFNRLKPEYRDSVLTLHKTLQNYADSEY